MKVDYSPSFLGRRHIQIGVLVLYLGLVVVPARSQTSEPASVRGTAKLNGTLVVEGVMVVAVPDSSHSRGGGRKATGSPVPAKVSNTGEYRIEGLSRGRYDLTAIGNSIKKEVISGVVLQAGNGNVVDIILRPAEKRTAMQVRIMNSNGSPLSNTNVAVYSSELPPSICETCMLAELESNALGVIDYADLAAEETYTLAARIPTAGNAGTMRLIAADAITIGNQSVAQVEMRVGEGDQPELTATLIPAPESAPQIERGGQPKPLLASTIPSGQQKAIVGVVTRRDSDTFVVRDKDGKDVVVRLDPRTSVKSEGGFLRSGKNYAQTELLRGLYLRVEGKGNQSGELVAAKIRFKGSDLRVARAVESRSAPLEDRAATTEAKLKQVEQNAQRLSGQLEELAAVSNAARGGARAAQATADAAIAGVNASNDRISALDDYDTAVVMAVSFRTGSAELSQDAKAALDQMAVQALLSRGYILEVSGHADSMGSFSRNQALSGRRSDAVIRYLVEKHQIPLRRIVTPYGYGETTPVAENRTRAGRAQNRRVEIRLLVNRGLTQSPRATTEP